MKLDHDVLRGPAHSVLLQLEARGVRFRLDGDVVLISPPGALTPEERAVFGQHRDAVRVLVAICTDEAIQARRDAFRREVEAAPPSRVPAFLFKPGVAYVRGLCFSCGDGLPELRFGRCWRCCLAWRLACRLPMPTHVAAAFDAARAV
jgi:hypothetical protein